MGNYDEMQADADDLGDAADIGERQGASLDVISKTLVQHPDLDQASSTGAEEAAMVVSEDEAKTLGKSHRTMMLMPQPPLPTMRIGKKRKSSSGLKPAKKQMRRGPGVTCIRI